MAIGIGVPFLFRSGSGGGPSVNPDFVIEVDTTQAGSASDTIILPLTSGGTYSGTIDWGDSSSDDLTYANRQHTYAAGGTYTITISGDTFEGWRVANSGDKLKFIDIQNWGFFTISSSDRQFDYCQNLNVTATDAPTITTTSFYSIFRNCDALTTPDFSGWDTSSVTNMQEAFGSCDLFNGNISNWVHSGVTNVYRMLINSVAFNQDLDTWNTSGVTNWYEMMRSCTAFNGDVSNWSVKGSLNSVFLGCTSFTGTGLSTWNTSNATSLINLFSGCTSLTGGFANWDVSNVTSLQTTFLNCDSITDSLASWDTSSVTSMYGTFVSNSALLVGIENWDTSAVTNMYRTFTNATNMNRNIGSWNTSLVTNMNEMLRSTAIDQDLSSWDINQVTNLSGFGIGITLSTANYDALLIAWDAQGTMSYSGTVNFGSSKYTPGGSAEAARTSLIGKWGGITDGGAAP
jgi:surface protein